MFVGKLDFEVWGIFFFFFFFFFWFFVFHGKSSIPVFTSKLDLYLRKQLINCYSWSIAWYGAGEEELD
jgi:hypothetical protein